MRGKERLQARGITARHAALRADAVDADVAPGGGEAGRVALRVVMMDQAEIKLRFGAEVQSLERREIGVVAAALGHRHVKELDRTRHFCDDGVRNLDHDAGVLRLHHVLVGGAAVAQVIAELDRDRTDPPLFKHGRQFFQRTRRGEPQAKLYTKIDGRDVLAYLVASAEAPAALSGRSWDIAGPDTVTYEQLIDRIAESMLVARPKLGLGFTLTPVASQLAAAVAGEDPALIEPLMEGLEHDLLPRDDAAAPAFGIRLHSFDAAVERALRDWELTEEVAAR